MDILKINGQAIVNPIALTWDESDLDSSEGSGRNLLGEMIRDRMTTKRKISVSFPPLNDHQMSTLLEALSPLFFLLEYPDPKLGKRHSITVYVSDRSVPVYMFDKTLNQWLWQGMTIDFIEK